jgi:hypothetical protein
MNLGAQQSNASLPAKAELSSHMQVAPSARLDGDNVMEAHNGCFQIHLDLGLAGVFLICAFLIATYRKVCKRLEPLTPLGSLGLDLWTLLLFYNVTEASLEVDLLFVTFLLAAMSMPERAEDYAPTVLPVDADFSGSPANVEIVGRGWSGAAQAKRTAEVLEQ